MAAFSGKNGSVKLGNTTVADVTKWTASHKANVATFASSSTGGWKVAVPGTEELSGDIEAKLQDSVATIPIDVNTLVSLELNTGRLKLSGQAIITQIDYEVDIDAGAPVGFRASWVSSGEWSYSGGSASRSDTVSGSGSD